jgi:inorganic triphosphatase YgiF
MSWKQERDLLIAETMAFAQSVSGKQADRHGFREALATEAPATEAPASKAPAGQTLVETAPAALPQAHPAARPPTLRADRRADLRNDVREEIRARVAAFRAHQELIRRDRDQYYNSVLAKVQTLTGRGRFAGDDKSLKR